MSRRADTRGVEGAKVEGRGGGEGVARQIHLGRFYNENEMGKFFSLVCDFFLGGGKRGWRKSKTFLTLIYHVWIQYLTFFLIHLIFCCGGTGEGRGCYTESR